MKEKGRYTAPLLIHGIGKKLPSRTAAELSARS